MDENRLEPKRYHRTGAGRQRPSRLWISRDRGRVWSGLRVLDQFVWRRPSRNGLV